MPGGRAAALGWMVYVIDCDPVATMLTVSAVPTTPRITDESTGLLITGGTGPTVRFKTLASEPLALLATMTTLNRPSCPVEPEMVPNVALAGSLSSANPNGRPEAE